MKIIHVFLIGISILGQVQQAWSQCENGTNTNPAAPTPANAGFKTNTFDWRQPLIPVTDKHGINNSALINPFFSTENYLAPIQGGWDSYSKHEEGWELIKQDFGYAYLNGTWNGRSILSSTNSSKQTVAYMMLYNRYTTTLRIIPNLDLSQTSNNSKIVVKISMMDKDNKVNYANLNFSALFNQYNKVQTALDQKTKATAVTASAQVQSSRLGFTFVDFKLSYDPCICFFESAFKIEFTASSISHLILQGRVLGNSTDIMTNNADPGENFLTSVLDMDVSDRSYNQTFYSEERLKEQMAVGYSQEAAGSILSWIKNTGKFVKAGKDIKTNAETNRTGTQIVNMLKAVVPYFEFASILIDLTKSESKIQNPTVITADLLAKGTITTNTVLNGQEVIMGVPGSKNASLLPEYPSSSTGGTKPMYPMYNEIPGHFAVLRTPELLYNYQLHQDAESGEVRKVDYIFKLPDHQDLSYALGPLVNAPKTQIFVGIEVKKNGVVNYVSSFLPLSQCKNLYALLETLGADPWHVSDLGIMGGAFDAADVKLVFQIFYDFKPDASGNSKTGYDLIKVKVNPVLDFAETSTGDPRYSVYAHAPTNLVMGETTVNNGNTIFSFGDIRITGNITNTGSTPLIIIAQGEVNIDPNVQLIGNIEIRSNQLFPPGITPVYSPTPPMTASAIQAFCQKSEYKANESLPPVREPESSVSQPTSNRSNLDLVVSPNPFKDELRVRLELSETDYVKLSLVNGLGQVVQIGLEETREKGIYEEMLLTQDLAPGIYYLTLQTKQGIQTKKIVKSL